METSLYYIKTTSTCMVLYISTLRIMLLCMITSANIVAAGQPYINICAAYGNGLLIIGK